MLTVADRDVVKTESKQVFKKKKAMHTQLYQWDLLKMPQPHLSKEDKQGMGQAAPCVYTDRYQVLPNRKTVNYSFRHTEQGLS